MVALLKEEETHVEIRPYGLAVTIDDHPMFKFYKVQRDDYMKYSFYSPYGEINRIYSKRFIEAFKAGESISVLENYGGVLKDYHSNREAYQKIFDETIATEYVERSILPP